MTTVASKPKAGAPPVAPLEKEATTTTTTAITTAPTMTTATPPTSLTDKKSLAQPASMPSTASPSPPATRRAPPPLPRAAGVDPLSDKATILLIRRTLCPKDGAAQGPGGTAGADSATPIEDLLPPLTSRNDVDLQLYALLAVIVREFVLTWYSKITPDDDQFVTEIVHIVAHCTRALEQRLRKVDLESLLLDELPALLDNHVRAYRASRRPLVQPPIETDPRAIYHALWPLPALSPVPPRSRVEGGAESADQAAEGAYDASLTLEQATNEAAYRQLLVRGLLAVLLPTEDLENKCLTSLVSQIFAELLVGNVLANRVAEPWMMYEIVGLVAKIVREKMNGDDDKDPKTVAKRKRAAARLQRQSSTKQGWLATTVGPVFWSVLKIGFALFASLRFLVTSITLSRSLPLRGIIVKSEAKDGLKALKEKDTKAPESNGFLDVKVAPSSASVYSVATSVAGTDEPVVPVLAFSVWSTVSNIVQLDVRMPWLYGGLSMLQWLAMAGPWRIAALNGPLDRLLSHYIHKYALEPALLPNLLRSIRGAIFPGNKFGATPPTLVAPANAAELAALKRRTAETVYAVYSDKKKPSEAVLTEIEGGLLDVFDDAYCNKHLLYGILEAIFVRLVPELADTGVQGLWEERLS
ncbi:hypothetical protein SEUCBS140593_005250 [Sporothrix eucalyptigena]|uniref:PXA domain-containing protein n=1 Tax=Sporothrix eucalyptigena TaxID=1812306 RepID=A0ABP0BV00_9PEZI